MLSEPTATSTSPKKTDALSTTAFSTTIGATQASLVSTLSSTPWLITSSLSFYPRRLSAFQLCEESDDEFLFCGPPSEPDESGLAELLVLEAIGPHTTNLDVSTSRRKIDIPGQRNGIPTAPRAAEHDAADASKKPARQPLVQPRGDIGGDNQKYICVFQIGLDDDEEFCLVKRILGKGGNNMRRIADECDAKVRLRGIGSGFLEGADGKEANMPLQLNISCSNFESYKSAAVRVATLLRDLYKHYRRYIRSKGNEPPELKINMEEVRRDDLAVNVLADKAQRSPSQRERDRKARERERKELRDKEKDRLVGLPVTSSAVHRERSREPLIKPRAEPEPLVSSDEVPGAPIGKADETTDERLDGPPTLPDGLPVPTTPAGRRAAARTGGAAAGAIASAAARDVERQEREKLRQDREREREVARQERERRPREIEERRKPKGKGKAEPESAKGKLKGRVPPPPPGPPPDEDQWEESKEQHWQVPSDEQWPVSQEVCWQAPSDAQWPDSQEDRRHAWNSNDQDNWNSNPKWNSSWQNWSSSESTHRSTQHPSKW